MTDKIKYILLDLPNFVKYCNKMDSREMRWLYLLANAGGKEDLPDMEDDVLNLAMGRISIESASESLLKTQEHSMIAQDEIICRLAEGKLQGIEEGRAEGRAEGIKSRNLELAKSFRDRGVAIDVIAESTGLDPKEIMAL